MADEEFTLLHPSGLRIARGLSEGAFLDSIASKDARRLDMHTHWVWYRLPAIPDGATLVSISLGFESGRLSRISLGDADPELGASWADWSEAKEQLRAERIHDWLVEKGFAPGAYPWGDIWAGFDAKGGFGGAVICYKVE